MARHFEVEVKPFNVFLNIAVAKDITSAMKYVKKTWGKQAKGFDLNEVGTAIGMYYPTEYKGLTYHTIFLTEDTSIGTIVHECFHALMAIADSKGAKWSHDSDEFYAYSLTEITQEIVDNIYGSRLRKK